MSSDADEKEPETEAPKPETCEIGEEFEEECCIWVAEVAVWSDFWDDGVAQVNKSCYSKPAWSDRDEL